MWKLYQHCSTSLCMIYPWLTSWQPVSFARFLPIWTLKGDHFLGYLPQILSSSAWNGNFWWFWHLLKHDVPGHCLTIIVFVPQNITLCNQMHANAASGVVLFWALLVTLKEKEKSPMKFYHFKDQNTFCFMQMCSYKQKL